MNSLTERVLGAIFEVSNTLGAGFLEKVYHRALFTELSIRGLQVVSQASFPVIYKGACVGEYFADFLVENVLLVELKCAERLTNEHTAQCLNYLRAFRHEPLSSSQLSETDGGVEANNQWFHPIELLSYPCSSVFICG
jgi:GxxExxY protein